MGHEVSDGLSLTNRTRLHAGRSDHNLPAKSVAGEFCNAAISTDVFNQVVTRVPNFSGLPLQPVRGCQRKEQRY